jgi:hypothetical protein
MKILVVLVSIGAVLCGGPVWAGGEGEEDTFKDTIRSMQERIKQLEDEVRQLRAVPPPPAPVAAPDLGPVEQRLKTLEDSFSPLQGLEVGGMVYGSYNYNFNNPDSKDNSLRIFDTRANNFTLDLAQLTIAKKEQEGIGFTVKLDYGRTARLIQSDWNGNGSFSNSTDNFELQEAYITYTAGIGKGLGVKAGKFVTLLGAEVIESPLNYNVSRSFMFGLAIPFTHTGLLLSYPFHDMVSLSAGVVNGWDNVLDSNKGKTFLGSLAFTPMESLIWTFNGTYGAEQPERGGSKRGVFDTVLTYKPIPNLDLVINYDYGTESELLADGDDAVWQGVAGIISIGGGLVNPEWEAFSLSQRLEWFSDEDGVRTGTSQDLWEATTTAKWKITERLMARVEYRHDESNKRVFSQKLLRREVDTSVFRFLHGQDTLSAELAFVY